MGILRYLEMASLHLHTELLQYGFLWNLTFELLTHKPHFKHDPKSKNKVKNKVSYVKESNFFNEIGRQVSIH